MKKFSAAQWRTSGTFRGQSISIFYFGESVVDTPDLQLPHPRIVGREFVLRPVADIRPDLVLPGHAESIADLLLQLPSTTGVVRVELEW